ncbi:LOW QUALITY PROTEIN: hypothetical protein Dda_2670 [Drechslerella dactyloides]|uniref:DUF1308 domain-containing protein n=1 Tax=Drechslerella dactyloides TaxID=74499 RepID=A0AAD6J4A3_DREDA|nr:LOW QUALITY PROTEIN: hypothetical protein Dda_2670 [Drechslerella dactyloides]
MEIISCDDLSPSDSDDDDIDSTAAPPLNPLADGLLQRCITLADELDLLEKKLLLRLPPKLRSKKGNLPIELRHFRSAIQVEQRSLEALCYKPPTDHTLHACRSSNLKFLESVWSVAKTCAGLQVIFRTVYLVNGGDTNLAKARLKPRGKEKQALKKNKTPVQVDIIAQSGLEWIKVANISQKRLETEFAKARWEAESFQDDDISDDDNDTEGKGTARKEELVDEFQRDTDAFSLVRSARMMVQAAQQTRVQYLHPEITIVMPNITYDAAAAADTSSPVHALVTAILATGARVQTANKLLKSPCPPPENINLNNPKHNPTSPSSPPTNDGGRIAPASADIHDILHTLSTTADPTTLITQTAILDCTVLLALVSDLSHDAVVEQPVFHRYILAQVRSEREEPLLPHWMYPALARRRLACTFDAYKRFREIVEIVGSEREKARAEALVASGGRDWKHPSSSTRKLPTPVASSSPTAAAVATATAPLDSADTLARQQTLQSLSRHTVPDTLTLPITVIESLEHELTATNAIAARIGPELSAVNRSSLFTAWQLGWTIVTTNGSVVKRLEWLVEENRMSDGDVGPRVHLLAIARSLVGKMKKGADILAGDRRRRPSILAHIRKMYLPACVVPHQHDSTSTPHLSFPLPFASFLSSPSSESDPSSDHRSRSSPTEKIASPSPECRWSKESRGSGWCPPMGCIALPFSSSSSDPAIDAISKPSSSCAICHRIQKPCLPSLPEVDRYFRAPTSSLIAKRRLFSVGRHRYAITAKSTRYTKFSHPSSTNHRVCQCVGTKSGDPVPANVSELRKKNPKMTMMLPSSTHHSRRYISALTFCLRSSSSFIVRLSELSVHT